MKPDLESALQSAQEEWGATPHRVRRRTLAAEKHYAQMATVAERQRRRAEFAEEHGRQLLAAVAAFLEKGNPTDKAGDCEQLKVAYIHAQVAFVPTDRA